MSEVKFRPDMGLRISIFAHILEYYRNVGVKSSIKNNDDINEISVLAAAIADRWCMDLEVFDSNYSDLQDALKDVSTALEEAEGDIEKLKYELAVAGDHETQVSTETPEEVEAPVDDEESQ